MTFKNSILGGAGKLIRQYIRSPNYVPNVSGWTINQDGSAEFTNLTARGNVTSNNVIAYGANGEILVYDSVPAAGNLICAISGGAGGGTDPYGNHYYQGITLKPTALSAFADTITFDDGTGTYLTSLQQTASDGSFSVSSTGATATSSMELFTPGSLFLQGLGPNGNQINNLMIGAGNSIIKGIQCGTESFSVSANSAAAGTITYPHAFPAGSTIIPLITPKDDHNFDWVISTKTSATPLTTLPWRGAIRNGVSVTGASVLDWIAIAI